MTNVLHFTSPHACYMCLLISCQSSSYSFLRRLLPRPLYPPLLFSRMLVDSRPGLDALKRKCTAPFLTSNHGPSLYLLSYPDSTFPLFWSKYFPRCVILRHLLTPVRHLPQKCPLFTVFMFLVHIPQTLRHRHAEHQPVLTALIPAGTVTLTHNLHVSSAALGLNSAQVKPQASIWCPPSPDLDCRLAAERNSSDVMTRLHEYRAVTLLLHAQTKKGKPKVTAGRRRS